MGLIFGVVEGDNQEIRNQVRGERAIRVDKSTRALMNIPYDHHEVHDGSSYFLETYNLALNAAASINIVLTTPDSDVQIHMIISMIGTGEFLGEIFESPTTVDGASATPLNRNRQSTNTSGCSAVTGATINGTGDLLENIYLGGGVGSGAHGGSGRGTNEWILKRNTKYLFRLTSQAADNECDIHLDWYEHTPKN